MRTTVQKTNRSRRRTRANRGAPEMDYPVHSILQLQRSIGNRGVQRALFLQPHLPVGAAAPKQIMRYALSDAKIKQWQALVQKALQGANDEKEQNLIAALGLIDVEDVNIARDGSTDPKKLTAGLNLDVRYGSAPGSTGYLKQDGWTSHLTIADAAETTLESASIIGANAFQSNSPVFTIMVIEHEKAHRLHQQKAIKLLKEWKAKADQKKFQKEFDKQKSALEKSQAWLLDTPDQRQSRLDKIQSGLVYQWFQSQKRSDRVEQELLRESMGSLQAKEFEAEVLAGLEGFIQGYHLIGIKDGVPSEDVFHELTAYPLDQGFWQVVNSKEFKAYYEKTLSDYYCKTLDDAHKKAFDRQAAAYEKKTWKIDAKEYFQMIKGITCKR